MTSPSDQVKSTNPQGSAPLGNAALGERSIEDEFPERAKVADNEKLIAQLERSNEELETQLVRQAQAVAKAKTGGQGRAGGHGKARHIAHAEGWQAICTAPDFCKVGKDVIAFNSFATLDKQHIASSNVKARGTAVYRKGDVIKNVQADAGKHVVSGTSLGSGHVKILDGHDNVKVNGIPVARHDSRCLINCDASGVGGAQGKLVTEQKMVRGAAAASNDGAAPGERTSEKLTALKKARVQIAGRMLNLNTADAYINFEESNEVLNDLIGQISGERGTALGYAAQVTRGVLGFAKDCVMGVGEMAFEGIKAVPKALQLTQTQSGRLLTQLDARILAENIKLGNITPGTIGRGSLDIGKAIVKPVTDPWAKGDYVEAVTRGVTEIGTLGLGWLKGNKAVRATKAADASKVAQAGKGATLPKADAGTATTVRTALGRVDDGVHVKVGTKPEFSGNWKNYETHGITGDPMGSAEGRRLVDEFENHGRSRRAATREARDLIKTGSTMPMSNPIEVGDKFFKVVQEGGFVGTNSMFWFTEAEIGALNGLNYNQIADRLGLPLASQPGSRFQLMEITAFRRGTSFTSVIAPTTELGANGTLWSQRGGGLQTLLTDRSIFTEPKLTGKAFP